MSEGELIGTSEWCDKCRNRAVVVDDHLEGHPTGTSHSYTTIEVEYRVLDLNCGHSKQWKVGQTAYRDPGA
jgi:hypothetical protein